MAESLSPSPTSTGLRHVSRYLIAPLWERGLHRQPEEALARQARLALEPAFGKSESPTRNRPDRQDGESLRAPHPAPSRADRRRRPAQSPLRPYSAASLTRLTALGFQHGRRAQPGRRIPYPNPPDRQRRA